MEEAIFEVGQALSIEAHFTAHVTTNVLGWDPDAFLLTRVIHEWDQRDVKNKQLKSRDVCKVRLLTNGVAYGFETVVLSVQFLPFPIMFLKYPAHVERVELRRTPRCRLSVPVRLSDASGIEIAGAVMSDVSEGGCLLTTPDPPGTELSIDTVYTLSFAIVDTTFSIDCEVKKLHERPDGRSIGLAFRDVSDHHRQVLAKVVDLIRRSPAG